MKFPTLTNAFAALTLASGVFLSATAGAAPVTITVSGTFTDAPDSLTVGSNVMSSLVGLGFTSTFSYNTTGTTINNEFGNPADGGTGQELGTEFTGGFASPSVPGAGAFTSPTLVAEAENNVTRTPADLLNLLPGGTYDFFSVNGWEPGSTFSGGSTIGDGGAIDGVSFGLTFIGAGSSALIDPLSVSDLMPTALDLSLITNVIVTIEEYENSELVGFAYQFGTIGEGGTFNNFTVVSEASEVSEPGMLALFPLAIGMIGYARRKRRTAA